MACLDAAQAEAAAGPGSQAAFDVPQAQDLFRALLIQMSADVSSWRVLEKPQLN